MSFTTRIMLMLLGGLAVGTLVVFAREATAADSDDGSSVDFATDVYPLLESRCVDCHGPNKAKADLRLDVKSRAFEGGLSGKAIVPGDSGASLLIHRVAGLHGEDFMPPKEADRLSPEEVALLEAWIAGGAEWPDEVGTKDKDPRLEHWAFQLPVKHDPPMVFDDHLVRNPIDAFVLGRLERENLAFSPEADRVTLVRRLYLDLIGLPPSPEEVDAFLTDDRPDAYEQLVDQLLASPQYGEHFARTWMDIARYADTNGYEKDRPREMWRWRDWVIEALNADMPYDQFTVEQIAGDMLPDATLDQRIATGFHRNTMINEEGGIDVEEFRYYSVVDRVETTGTAWLGLTIQCAQCHNHKYDPISQREYFEFFSLLNNADEPMMPVPTEAELAAHQRVAKQVAALEAKRGEEFPLDPADLTWTLLDPVEFTTTSGGKLVKQPDRSLLAKWAGPQRDTYTVRVDTDLRPIVAFKLETLTDSELPHAGPGLADNGNFVLSEFSVAAGPKGRNEDSGPVTLGNPSADFAQGGLPVRHAIDNSTSTGWGVDNGGDQPNSPHHAIFETQVPLARDGGQRLTFTLSQQHGDRHLIGRFRLWAATIEPPDDADAHVARLREAHRVRAQAAWEARMERQVADWRVLDPLKFESKKHATMTELEDRSILVTGDRPTRDVYTVTYDVPLDTLTGLRLEALTDDRIPHRGPGRGSGLADGNFMLNELEVEAVPLNEPDAEPVTVAFRRASATGHGAFAGRPHTPGNAIDGDIDSGWSVLGQTGRDHAAVFECSEPVTFEGGARLTVRYVQNFIDQHTLGRFRLSATADRKPLQVTELTAHTEALLVMPDDWRNAEQRRALQKAFLDQAEPLAERNAAIAETRREAPEFTTTLVMQEREKDPRQTHIHIRGEYKQKGEPVLPAVPDVLPPLPEEATKNRLTLARWLVSRDNPLTARVAVNRAWQHFFGRGIVRTAEDFGTQGDPPTHPELLDWLAIDFMDNSWSMKRLHKRIVMSATYRQSSLVTPELLERDPENQLLARGPRFRMSGEVIRDAALKVSGLLSLKRGGPSVYPPQPPGVTSLSYGPLAWYESKGEDRYRRSLYTFIKRTAPYAAYVTFDAPMRDTCTVRRVRSNTPLQSLTLMNDPVFVEASQALARRIVTEGPEEPESRIAYAFRWCVTRSPEAAKVRELLQLYQDQYDAIGEDEGAAAKIALADPSKRPEGVNLRELAAWTLVANALLNLDETITKP